MNDLIEAKRQLYVQIKDIPGVEGVGCGEDFLWLYFSYVKFEDEHLVPREFMGYDVKWKYTGKLEAYDP